MKMNKIYGLCAVQLMGVGVQIMNRVAGSMIVFLGVIAVSYTHLRAHET